MKYFPEYARTRPHMKPEAEIVSRVITSALRAGYHISVFDGEEWAVKFSRDRKEIESNCFATDETHFRIRTSDQKSVGSVWFIHGNGGDVIADYTDDGRMDELLEPAFNYADKINA